MSCLNKMTKLSILVLIIVFLLPLCAKAQFWKRKINQDDTEKLKTGLWIDYWDDEKTQIMSKYHYIESKETKVCKNFHPNGKKSIKFKYVNDRVKVKYYNEQGKITQKGWAVLEYGEEIRYYWHGKWKYFEAGHRIVKTTMYMNGQKVSFIKKLVEP